MEILMSLVVNATPEDINSTSNPQWGVPYLKKLAHLDEGLYQEFYGLWVTLMVVNTLMFVVGVVLNSLALYIFCLPSQISSAPVVYTINLAVADLLVALSLPARIALYHSGGGCLACSYVHTFSYFVNMYCSILFLTSICVDRYIAVVWAGAGRRWRSPGVAKGVSVGIWLLAVVVTYSFQTTELEIKATSCCRLTALFALSFLEFLLPLVVIVTFTLRVACALTDPRLMPQSQGRRARAVRLLVAVLVVFSICFMPFHVRQALVYFRMGGDRAQQVLAYHATVTLSSLNSCLDPVVYCLVTDSFRSAMRRACRKRPGAGAGTGAEVEVEVEAEAERTSGGDVASGLRSSKGSGTAMAIAHSVATLTLTPCTLQQRDMSA
ncbi:G-protein coupled receptor 20 [Oncorhynchus nerka]|uniref:G-protein coupled receptor 20 n=1 Tax=Oncorhynchus nerka TaxID=8023 RepID=UPI00113265F8|nr:G-protein coupled receptor 20-like [Oncorhynchus nerka]